MKVTKILFITLLSLKASFFFGQTSCQDIYDEAIIEKEKGNFKQAINKINALFLCLDTFQKSSPKNLRSKAEKLNLAIFTEVNNAKEKENIAKKKVQEALKKESIAKERAIKEANTNTSLYWSSEARHINPAQSLYLLEKAIEKSNDTIAVSTARIQTEEIFNASNTHQFNVNHIFSNTESAIISSDYRWVVTKHLKKGYRVWDISKKPIIEFFTENKLLDTAFISPDSKWLFTKNINKYSKLLNLNNNKELSFLKNEREISKALFSPDSKLLYTIDNKESKIWNIYEGKFFTYSIKGNDISSVWFSQDSKWICIKRKDKKYEIWNVSTGKKESLLEYEKGITKIDFSPDSRWIYTINDKSDAKIWEISTNNVYDVLKKQIKINEITYSSDSKWIIVNSNEGLHLLDIKSGLLPEFLNTHDALTAANFSPDSKWLYTIFDKKVNITEISTGKIFEKNVQSGWLGEGVFSSNNEWIIEYSNSEPQIQNLVTGKKYNYLQKQAYISLAAFSKDGKYFRTTQGSQEYKVWESSTGRIIYDFKKEDKYTNKVYFSPNFEVILTGNSKNEFKIWKTEFTPSLTITKNVLKRGALELFSPDNKWLTFMSETGPSATIIEVSTGSTPDFLEEQIIRNRPIFSNDKIWIASYIGKKVKVWNLNTKEVREFFTDSVKVILFSPNSKFILALTTGKSQIWDVTNGQEIFFLKDEKNISQANFSSDGNWLTIRNGDEGCKLWEVSTGRLHNHLNGVKSLYAPTFINNGRWIQISNLMYEREIVELNTGKRPLFLQKSPPFKNIIISPDNNLLFTTDNEETSKLWNISKGKEMLSLGSGLNSNYVCFSPDGKWLFTKNKSNECKLWNTYTNESYNLFIEEADKVTNRFSNDSNWIVTFGSKNISGHVWNLVSDIPLEHMKLEKNSIDDYHFSPKSKWLITKSLKNLKTEVWDLSLKVKVKFLQNAKEVIFSSNNDFIVSTSNHKVIVWEVATGKPIQTLFLNKLPKKIIFKDNRFLFTFVGNALIRTDISKNKGFFFIYGDDESLDYTFEEIQEWKKNFGNKYLVPLDKEIKKKYGIPK
jgi:WD40 repeat protein